MAAALKAVVEAGAVGFTTSRTYAHRTRDGLPLGTRFSSEDELMALVGAMGETGRGVVQMISDAYITEDDEFAREQPRRLGVARAHRVALVRGDGVRLAGERADDAGDRLRLVGGGAFDVGCVANGVGRLVGHRS